MFDPTRFVQFCKDACEQADPSALIQAELLRIVADPAAIARPPEGDRQAWRLHRSPTLTVLHTTYPPALKAMPHNHGTWAVVSVYQGQEDYVVYDRNGNGLVPIATNCIRAGQAVILAEGTIHDLCTSAVQPTCSIHVYGGDLFDAQRRSMWAPPGFQETAFNEQDFAGSWPGAKR
jgi:predicted metal-dependent enzyme (double-stranded beta helix superfamily)